MVIFPNCKINLGLRIIKKRDDGYHDLETIFYPLPLNDALEAITINETASKFSQSGLIVQGSAHDNLCVKAYDLLKNKFPQLPVVAMHLHKNIPMGAGLGGGSSDGAFMLSLLNEKYHLGLTREQLIDLAIQLGSDCPFFIINKPCYATGRGEFLEPINIDLSKYSFLIIHPGIHISTSDAFSMIKPSAPEKNCKEIVGGPIQYWKDNLINDFEIPVFVKFPELRSIKEKLYKHGALYASMSGSGSALFGIFAKNEVPLSAFADPRYTIHTIP